jgi:hypothetical protein
VASHTIALTGHIVCMGDDFDPPHAATLTVPPDVDGIAIGEALLRSPWLPTLGSDTAWAGVAGAASLVFGLRFGTPFVHCFEPEPVRAESVSALHIRDAAQPDFDVLFGSAESPTRASTGWPSSS